MRRLKRHEKFELKLEINDKNFIAPPRAAQRNWLVNRAIAEFCWDLEALDHLAQQFVPGRETLFLSERDSQSPVADDIMELWQIPIMERMADLATTNNGDVLEIGYGRGVSADMIQQRGVQGHTIVECVPAIAEQCRQWGRENDVTGLCVLEGRWEEVEADFSLYDGIFFHTYPMDSEEYAQTTRNSATVAESFFPVAAKHLKAGGIFTYFTNEMDSLSRAHQRALFHHFSQISLQPVTDLAIPDDVKDTWWIDQMVVVAARVKA